MQPAKHFSPQTLTTRSELRPKPRFLTLQDVESAVPVPFKVEDGYLILERSLRSWKLKEPVKAPLDQVLALGDRQLLAYIITAFASVRPRLIPLVLENHSLTKLARRLLYRCSGSPKSLYNYTEGVSLYSRFLDHSPDTIIDDVKNGGNIADAVKVENHIGLLQDYADSLQANGLSPSRVHGLIKEVRTFYRVNGVELKPPEGLSRRVKYRDRAPTPEELSKMLDLADLRDKVIVLLATLGGFREETLTRLQYQHVKEDLEKGVTPVHVHVEAEIVKGKYADYDTFLGPEAAEALRLYLDDRRKGSGDGRRPPEQLKHESPLIRSETSHKPTPISPKQVRKRVHDLYRRAGLLKRIGGRMYNLREHSFRKYFKTQLISRGAPESHVDYMMGHVTDTYNDIQSLGIEKLRQEYAASGLSIKPKTRTSVIETIKEILRAAGKDPEQILTREALTEGATTHINPAEYQDHHIQILRQHLKQLIHPENPTTSMQVP